MVLLLDMTSYLYGHFGNTDRHLVFTDLLVRALQISEHPKYIYCTKNQTVQCSVHYSVHCTVQCTLYCTLYGLMAVCVTIFIALVVVVVVVLW